MRERQTGRQTKVFHNKIFISKDISAGSAKTYMLCRTFCSRALIPVKDLETSCRAIAFFFGILVGSGSKTVLLFIGVGISWVISPWVIQKYILYNYVRAIQDAVLYAVCLFFLISQETDIVCLDTEVKCSNKPNGYC